MRKLSCVGARIHSRESGDAGPAARQRVLGAGGAAPQSFEAKITVRKENRNNNNDDHEDLVVRLDPVLDFMRLLWTLEHGLQSASKRMESALGVTGPQRLVLRIVGRHPGISAGQLAHIAQLHPSTITGIVQRLVRKGALVSERDPLDNRRVRLHLRPEAKAFTKMSKSTVESAVKQTLSRMTPRQLQAARELLGGLAQALD